MKQQERENSVSPSGMEESRVPVRPVYLVLTWPRIAAIVCALLVIAVLAPMLVIDIGRPPHERAVFRRASTVRPASGPERTATGTWGTLRIEPIVIEPPRAFFLYTYKVPPRRWEIPDVPPRALAQELSSQGLSAEAAMSLLPLAVPGTNGTGSLLMPSDELVGRLSSSDRAVLYGILGRYPVNELQYRPFYFRGKSTSEWFAESELPESVVDRINALVYRRNECMLFSDLDLVWGQLGAAPERTKLLRILSRVNAVSLHLFVDPGDDIGKLTDYWGQGGREDLVEPILTATQAKPGESLDVIYLLPAFARTRLYSYVNPTQPVDQHRRDCHWTTFNFFNQEPDARFSSVDNCVLEIQARYEPVRGDLKMGDVICLTTEAGVLVHSCVYIAADVVFTKNGEGSSSPYVLEDVASVLDTYRRIGATQVRYFRRK